ncbi:MAG: hypothetical protein QXH24_03575 [Candidatus Bathyarchaeia archaeon]
MDVPDVTPIFECMKEIKRHHIHIEISNLVIPKIGDSMENIMRLVIWIRENLGPDTPLHFLKYRERCPMSFPPIPPQVFGKAREVALKEGLKYVYTPMHRNTYCPSCDELLIERLGDRPCWPVFSSKLTADNVCLNCGEKIPIVGRPRPNEEVSRRLTAIGITFSAWTCRNEYWGFEG